MSSESWLANGQGTHPDLRWACSTDAPLASLQMARETGETLAADESGGLYLITRDGQIASLSRGPQPLRAVAWSDTGVGGAALVGPHKVYWLTSKLEFKGWIEVADDSLALAISPHGEYVAVSVAGSQNLIFDGPRKPLHHFESIRPLVQLEFLAGREGLLGLGDFGLLASYRLNGRPEWQEKLWSSAGNMSATGDGGMILVAGFSHGIQRFDETGSSVGSYQVEGTVSRVATSYMPYRIAAATVEQQLYWLAFDGRLIWAAQATDEIVRIIVDPFGEGMVVGFASGRILRLEWPRRQRSGAS